MTAVDTQKIESASLTSIGRIRTTNQDYFGEFVRPNGDRLLVVADGMGGHRGGATASRLATETIGSVFESSMANSPDTLYDALNAANSTVHQTSLEDPELRGMGTTIVTVLFDSEGAVWVAHVGDSRAYRLHEAGMEQITEDHSVVGEMVRRGMITSDQAEVHPRRNEILRSIGVESSVEIDVARVASAPGDVYVLCSDGLSGLVSDAEIASVVQSASPEVAAARLVAMANDRGAPDNVTVQVAKLPPADEATLMVEAPIVRTPPSDTGTTKRIALLVAALVLVACAYFLIKANGTGARDVPEASPTGTAGEPGEAITQPGPREPEPVP